MAQSDVHGYATLALAKAAKYSDQDSVLLAWSNIETDHSLQVQWWNCAWSNLGLYAHFWPGNCEDLICRVDSELVGRIIGTAIGNIRHRLCALGIALHGLQDTYFHQNWLGKFSRHNCLPVWSRNTFTPSLPFPYGHSPMAKMPDIANATWYDPRTGDTVVNKVRVELALEATAKVLGLEEVPLAIRAIFWHQPDYDTRKQKLRELAGMPYLRFSRVRAEMMKKYGKEFTAAAKEQARIVKEYLK